jgi:hypothetical protein
MAKKVMTPAATVSYPALFAARTTPSGDKKYSACLIFDRDANLTALKAAAMDMATERWGPQAKQMFAAKQLRWPFRDGAEKAALGFGKGKTFINVSSSRQPGVVGRHAGLDGKPTPITNPDEVFAGCLVRATLLAFAYDTQGNKGVSFLLGNVQKLGDGPRLDGRLRAEDEFEAIESAPASFDDDNLDDPMAA